MKTLILLLIPVICFSQSYNVTPVYLEIQDAVITKEYKYEALSGLHLNDGVYTYIANAPRESFTQTDSIRIKKLYYLEVKQEGKECALNVICFQPITYEKVYLNMETIEIINK